MLPPKVSVITTCYNRQAFIGECILSVLQSQYENFEYIIVDDCSTDRSWEIISEFALQDSRIRAIQNQINLGDYPNRNRALTYATGEYVKFVDSDDLMYPYALHVFVHHMEAHPDAGLCLSVSPHFFGVYPQKLEPLEALEVHYLQRKRIFHEGPTSAFFRYDAMNRVGNFSETRMSGDFETWHKLAATTKLLLLPKGSYMFWRTHNDQENAIHQNDAAYNFQYFDFSIRFLSGNTNSTKRNEHILHAALTEFYQWCFFILRTHGIRKYNRFPSLYKPRWFKLLPWATKFYLLRHFRITA